MNLDAEKRSEQVKRLIESNQDRINFRMEKMKMIEDKISIIISFCNSNNDASREKLYNYCQLLFSSNHKSKKVRYMKKIINYLRKCSENNYYFSLDGINIVNDKKYEYLFKNNHELEEYFSNYFSNDISNSLITLCREYIYCMDLINDCKKEIKSLEDELKDYGYNEKSRDVNHNEDYPSENLKETDLYDYDDHSGYFDSNDNKQNLDVDYKSSSLSIKNDIDKIISIQDQSYKEIFSKVDYNYNRRIKDYFYDKVIYTNLCDTVDPIIKNNKISIWYSKCNVLTKHYLYTPSDVMDFAINVYNYLPLYLENKHLIDVDDSVSYFYDKFNVAGSLSEYENIYNKYMKAYSLMMPRMKEIQNKAISEYHNKNNYSDFFGDRIYDSPKCIISPDELRKAINRKIISNFNQMSILEMHQFFEEKDRDASKKLGNLTSFMDEDEIAKLYHTVMEARDLFFSTGAYTEWNMDAINAENEVFQRRILNIIISKRYASELSKMPDEDRIKFVESKYKEISLEVLEDDYYTSDSQKKCKKETFRLYKQYVIYH